ncbi:MAG: IS110 family transposase, partial [Chloroflexi bacterium]|nr:IS110 family transposase [Chloroflexota bacterium]
MHSVGIDIGKRQHVAAICRDGTRSADKAVLRFASDRAGLSELERWLHRQGPVERVVMESSGHYWMALAAALHRQAVPVAIVNPVSAKNFGKRRLQRIKSDPADARTLAALGMADQPAVREPLAGAELREAARFAMTLVTEQSRVCNRITRLVELGFPELEQAYDDPTCTSALAVLRLAPTAAAISRKRVATLADANRAPGHRAIGARKAEQIAALAKDTIAPPELSAQLGFEMELLIAQYDLLERQIAAAETRVAGMLDGELARRLQTIPGVGPAICATLIAEIGDIHRFRDFDKLVAYVGVHPAEKSSGQKGGPETSWQMAKTGNAHIRAALYQLSVVGLQHNPTIKAHY